MATPAQASQKNHQPAMEIDSNDIPIYIGNNYPPSIKNSILIASERQVDEFFRRWVASPAGMNSLSEIAKDLQSDSFNNRSFSGSHSPSSPARNILLSPARLNGNTSPNASNRTIPYNGMSSPPVSPGGRSVSLPLSPSARNTGGFVISNATTFPTNNRASTSSSPRHFTFTGGPSSEDTYPPADVLASTVASNVTAAAVVASGLPSVVTAPGATSPVHAASSPIQAAAAALTPGGIATSPMAEAKLSPSFSPTSPAHGIRLSPSSAVTGGISTPPSAAGRPSHLVAGITNELSSDPTFPTEKEHKTEEMATPEYTGHSDLHASATNATTPDSKSTSTSTSATTSTASAIPTTTTTTTTTPPSAHAASPSQDAPVTGGVSGGAAAVPTPEPLSHTDVLASAAASGPTTASAASTASTTAAAPGGSTTPAGPSGTLGSEGTVTGAVGPATPGTVQMAGSAGMDAKLADTNKVFDAQYYEQKEKEVTSPTLPSTAPEPSTPVLSVSSPTVSTTPTAKGTKTVSKTAHAKSTASQHTGRVATKQIIPTFFTKDKGSIGTGVLQRYRTLLLEESNFDAPPPPMLSPKFQEKLADLPDNDTHLRTAHALRNIPSDALSERLDAILEFFRQKNVPRKVPENPFAACNRAIASAQRIPVSGTNQAPTKEGDAAAAAQRGTPKQPSLPPGRLSQFDLKVDVCGVQLSWEDAHLAVSVDQFAAATKPLCGFPSFFAGPLFRRIRLKYGGTMPDNPVNPHLPKVDLSKIKPAQVENKTPLSKTRASSSTPIVGAPNRSVWKVDSAIPLVPDEWQKECSQAEAHAEDRDRLFQHLPRKNIIRPKENSRGGKDDRGQEMPISEGTPHQRVLKVVVPESPLPTTVAGQNHELSDRVNSGLISLPMFLTFWVNEIEPYSPTERLFYLVKQRWNQYIEPIDFMPFLEELLAYHPGLAFLENTPEFQEKYARTVTCRIFFEADLSGKRQLDLRALKQCPKLLEAFQFVDIQEDINAVNEFFSYEHFYVLYCKFWELDSDHDTLLTRADLSRIFSLTPLALDRVFSQHGKPFVGSDPEGRMSFDDFISFFLSVEDKTTPAAIRYWFQIFDIDGDGIITINDLKPFYYQQSNRMRDHGLEIVKFEDIVCQFCDLLKPAMGEGMLTVADFLHPERIKLSGMFFNAFVDLEKFQRFETREPAFVKQAENYVISQWTRYAAVEYQRLATEEEEAQAMVSGGNGWM